MKSNIADDKHAICGAVGSPGNSDWLIPICDKTERTFFW